MKRLAPGGGHVSEQADPTPQEIAARAKAEQVRRQNAPRTRRILRLKSKGLSLSQIGEAVGLTRQRVHAILRANEAA